MTRATTEQIDMLVVDGDGSQYRPLVEAVDEAGLRLVHANDGHHALQIISARPARLWLSNLALPDMAGIELLRIVRAKRPTIPFYLFSDDYTVADEVAARAAGATGYLSKPVNHTWIEICLATLIRRTVRAGPQHHAPPRFSAQPTHRTNVKPHSS